MIVENILFDLDNTLARCMVYFEFVRKNISKTYSNISGLSVERVDSIFNSVESSRINKKNAFSKEAFLETIDEVRTKIYTVLKNEESDKEDEFYNSDIPFELIKFASKVYEAPYTIYEDVPEVLAQLKSKGINLYVVTKGDFYGQSRKAANLPEVFTGLFVLPYKNASTWDGVCKLIQLNKETTLVVGDSVHDDINPAIENGLRAIRVNRLKTNWVGDPEVETLTNVPEISNFSDLVKIITNLEDDLPF